MAVETRTNLFTSNKYLIRKKVLKLAGGVFHIYEPDGRLAFYSKQKAFKLKEDIRVFTDESMATEALTITARKILDFSAAYDVVDSMTGEKVGALKRKGFKSMLRDEWVIMDASDNEIGSIQEDSMFLALLRRFLSNLIPQTYAGSIDGKEVCLFRQNFNPFVTKINVDFTADTGNLLDRRLGMAASILLCAIEGKQG
ncbi:MAG: hypothetical protein KAX16_08405 [Actinomycetia bacterium]|nr:hypothetical protein [Actinomycetes bacterium]